MTNRIPNALLAVVYAKGNRPTLTNLSLWQARPESCGFSVTHSAKAGQVVWAELLTNGLAFDCLGLGEGAPGDYPEAGQRLGLDRLPVGETVTLQPGPHILSGANLPPVVRALVGLGAQMARLPSAQAVCWLPSNCWMSPEYFIRIVEDWLAGGAFPALGLTTLERKADGDLETHGLAFFIGQEVILESDKSFSIDRMAQLGIRLINELIGRGPLFESHDFAFDGFPQIKAVPAPGGDIVRVTLHANAR